MIIISYRGALSRALVRLKVSQQPRWYSTAFLLYVVVGRFVEKIFISELVES
jgi:hypothetical protein